VLAPPTGFAAAFCVYQSGTPSCPVGYPKSHVFYSGENDTRNCSTCACSSAPTGGTCAGTITLYGDLSGGCTGPSATFTLGQQACTGAPAGTIGVTYSGLANSPGFAKANFTVTPGACTVTTPPTPIGSVVGTGPTTVCCM
jgi:hypothetical protein